MYESRDFRHYWACSGLMAMTQRIVVYIGTSGVSPESFILVIATAAPPQQYVHAIFQHTDLLVI